MLTVVTGATGHIGANLVRALLDSGRDVRVLVHGHTRALEGLNVDRVHGDVLHRDSLDKAFRDADTVYHLAAIITLKSGRDDRAHAVNVDGTRNVVEACLAAKVSRLVHFSSIHALSPEPADETVDETRALVDPAEGLPYDRSKVLGESAVQEGVKRGLRATILHPTGVIGPYDFGPSQMGRQLINMYKRRIPALVTGGFNWVDVRDVCQGAMAAEQNANGAGKYVLAGNYITFDQLRHALHAATGVKPPPFMLPLWFARALLPASVAVEKVTGKTPPLSPMAVACLDQFREISIQKAQSELGYRPRPFHETLADTFEWFRREKYI